MSLSQEKDEEKTTDEKQKHTRFSVHQVNPSYTVRVICCIVFICLTEIFLAHYVYRLITYEITDTYISKSDLRLYVQHELHSTPFQNEVTRIAKEVYAKETKNSIKKQDTVKDEKVLPSEKETTRKKRSVVNNRGNRNYLRRVQNEEPHIEFFLDDKGEDRRRHENKGTAPGGDSWIWVTSSSRIPEKALEGYCQKVGEFCPVKAGPQGPKGDRGLSGPAGPPGVKGDTGPTGLPGLPGLMGLPGEKGEHGKPGRDGFPGEKGEAGRPGLDGRVGLPGQPGLYGQPGRNGQDGLPGKDGQPGKDGKDGVNGQKGERGLPGPAGPQGPKGLTGPRGRPGKPGINGIPGTPGIQAYKAELIDGDSVLLAPSIAAQNGPIIVHEGENVRLECSAHGNPPPRITWQRKDNRPINMGAWQVVHFSGNALNFTSISRSQMGTYLCVADNGIPPQANQSFPVEVYFPPLIKIVNQMVGVSNGSTAVLECETEAYPEPLRYWERSDGRLLESGDKFRIDNIVRSGYKSRMQLNITRVTTHDTQYLYYCISKNELKMTRGEFKLYELDPSLPPPITPDKEKIYGYQPPEKIFTYEELCGPPPVTCPECETPTCTPPSGVSLIDLITRWEIRPYDNDKQYSGNLTRATDCVLYAVGKPVYHKFTDYNYGCWMRDSERDYDKIWVTTENNTASLLEFANKSAFNKNTPTKQYHLDHPFGGNSHVIHNGYFFYNVKDTNRIIRYNLDNESTASLDLPGPANHIGNKLYSTQYNYVDFCVDDNGLWLIFAVPDSNNTAVMKVDIDQMKAQYIWNISIEHQKVGEMFIVCGVLYAVDNTTVTTSKIRFALDLYKNTLLDVSLTFSNPFKKTTMVGYNHRYSELYSWDRGNQLTYPVRYHHIGYNSTKKEERTVEVNNS